jgi:hypothetical protein
MKFKIALFVILNIIAILAYAYFVPGLRADVALTQFDEGSAGIRAAEKAHNLYWVIYPAVNVLLIAWIAWNPVKCIVAKIKTVDSE